MTPVDLITIAKATWYVLFGLLLLTEVLIT
jgi:hypothetical protein